MYVILQDVCTSCGQMMITNHTLDFVNANVCYMAAQFSLVYPISCSILTDKHDT